MLVGGGELHERWEALVRVERPLSRRIQGYTGITQAMVDEAPPAEASLPELADLMQARVLVAHSASFDRRVLTQAFERAELEWPDPPVICTIALARRLHPLARQRRLAALAGSLGIEVETVHRALADAETCARIFCALFPRLVANAPTVGRALELLAPPRRARRRAGATDGGGTRRGRSPPASGPQRPRRLARRLRRPQRGGAGALRRQVDARAHACARALRAVLAVRRLDRARRDRRAPPHGVGARRAGARAAARRAAAPAGQREPQGERRLVLAALPPRHRLPGARGRARARRRARGQRRAAARARDGRRARASS